MNRAEQRAIIAADRERRETQAAVAIEPLNTDRNAYANPELVHGIGVVTPPSDARVTRAYAGARAGRSSWANVSIRDAHKSPTLLRPMPVVGTGYDDDGNAVYIDGSNTVKVTRDGETSFVTIGTFRQSSDKASTGRTSKAAPPAPHKMTCADMAPIQGFID